MPQTRPVDPRVVALLRTAGCVYPEDEALILTEAAGSSSELDALLARRVDGEPLEYVVGWAEFCGIRIPVRPGVFIPRRRSEFLADCAARTIHEAYGRSGGSRSVKVLDLCCGSGALGLVIAARSEGVELLASDISPVAVECARENLARVGGRVYQGDLYAALPQAELHSLDLIVVNAPYVPTGEIRKLPAEARLYEPVPTLDGGPDGMSLLRRVLDGANDWLAASGHVVIETGSEMAEATAQIAGDAGFSSEVRRCADMNATVVGATRS